MPIISFICLILILLAVLSTFKGNIDLLSPGRTFFILWVFIIGLAEFKFSRLQFHWNLYGWFMLLIGLLTFLLGLYIQYIINFNKPFLSVQEIRDKLKFDGLDEKKLFRFIILYFFLYVICYTTESLIVGYIPFFTAHQDKARQMYGVFGIHLVVVGINIILFLIIQYFIFVKEKAGRKTILATVFIIASGSFFLLLQRYNFFILSMMAFALYYYSGKKIRLRSFLVFALIVIAFVYGIQTIRTTKLLQAYFVYYSQMKFSAKYGQYAIPYMYFVMNVENFVKEFPKISMHTYGLFTFDFLTALVGVKHWLLDYLHVEKFPHYIAGYNTFPFFWVYYYDFGVLGLAGIPFLIGFFIGEIYYSLHRSPTLVMVSLYSIAFSVIIVSFISDPLTRLDMMFNFVVIVLVQFYITKKDKRVLSK